MQIIHILSCTHLMNSQKGNWRDHDTPSPNDLYLFPIKEKLSQNHSDIIIIMQMTPPLLHKVKKN